MSQIYNGSFVLGDTSATTLSAGTGIKLDTSVPGVIGISNDETVLWSGNNGVTACSLSESPSSFDRIRFYGYRDEGSIANSRGCWEFPTTDMTGFDISQLLYNNEGTYRALYLTRYALNGLNLSALKYQHFYATTGSNSWAGQGTCVIKINKVIGVNRINGGV